MSNIDKRALAMTKELATLMVERFSMNPVSCKLLNEAWKKEFPDEVAIAERMLALLDELEAKDKQIAELEAKLEAADKLQDSSFRHGLQHGFSLGQTDNQAGFEECLSAYGTRGKDNG